MSAIHFKKEVKAQVGEYVIRELSGLKIKISRSTVALPDR